MQVDRIITALGNNSLFAPDVDKLMSDMGSAEVVGGKDFAEWVKQNFTKTSDVLPLLRISRCASFCRYFSLCSPLHPVRTAGRVPGAQRVHRAR